MNIPDENFLKEDIAENKFFHEFLLFLRALHRRPLGLTKKGNLKRAEIYYFGEHFLVDIYHRNEKGLILFPILTENEAPYLVRIHTIAKVMELVDEGKDRLLLSTKGKAFLNNPSVLGQFEQTILSYLTQCNWRYLHLSLYKLAEFLQNNQHYIWSYMIRYKNKEINFQTFYRECTYTLV